MATVRSPSPNPSRAKTPDNSSRRNTKPSISIDPHLRNSCSKENEKRATVHSSGKASKNFMAPTISAASKVAAPSPRKKILRERNELSHSLETANILASPEIFGGSSRNSLVVPLPEVAAPSPRKHPQLCSPSPADDAGADPSSVPPYDPKTNYLSPRPQFLHYRPNPRIHIYASTEGKGLEASFSSESDDDCGAVATEEKDSEEECSTPSVPSEVEEEEEEVAALDETLVVEPEPESKDSKPFKPLHPRRSKLVPFLLAVAIACVFMPLSDSPLTYSPVPNDQSLMRLYSPPSGMYGDWRLGEYRAVASVKLHDLASRFKRWSRDSVAYFGSVPSYAGEVGLVGLVNMTSPADDDAIGSDFIYKHELEVLEVVSEGSAENEAEKKEMDVSGEIIEIDDTKHEAEGEAIEVEVSGAVHEVAEFETELVLEEASGAIEKESEALDEDAEKSAMENVEYEAEKVDDTKHLAEGEVEVSGAVNEVAEFETELVVEEESGAIEDEALDEDAENSAMENVEYEAEKVDTEVYKNVNAAEFRADKFETEVPENGAANIDEPTTETHQDSSHIQPATSSQVMVGYLSAAFLLLVVVVVAAFLCTKQKKTPLIATTEMHTSKKVLGSVSDSWRASYTPTKGKGNEDLMGDFGYSIASSGLDNNTFSYGQHHQTKRGEEEDDNLGHERRPRRDSTASSSVSYGSFTTYERLSAKKGYKDEEVVVTPVRRSSRLRSHVTTSS